MVTAEIPGMEQKDLDVNLSGDVLTIKGEKKAEHEEKGDDFHRSNGRTGAFHGRFLSLVKCRQTKVEAGYKGGVLTLKLPKSESCRKKAVKITVH